MSGKVSVGFIHPGHWSACFAHCLTDLLFFDAAHKQRIVSHPFGQIANECHAARIAEGRNDLALTMLDHSPAEWLFMIDSDMGFDADIVERLIESADHRHRPVVGGLCFAQKSDGNGPFKSRRFRMIPTIYRMYETDEKVGFVPIFDYPRDELVEVDTTGGACLLIHRKVLQKLRDIHGDRWFTPITLPKGEKGYTDFSEDMSFLLRVRAAGFPIYVDTSVKTTHDKGGVFLDEDTYDLQQAMFELFPRQHELDEFEEAVAQFQSEAS